MVISTCVVLGLSVASQRYRGLIEFSSLQRSLKGRDYRPPLAACGMAAANTEVEPNLNPPSPAWKLRALFMYLLGHQAAETPARSGQGPQEPCWLFLRDCFMGANTKWFFGTKIAKVRLVISQCSRSLAWGEQLWMSNGLSWALGAEALPGIICQQRSLSGYQTIDLVFFAGNTKSSD